ncbi:MAG: hypothetical protein MJ066_00060 [Clostridia bacterium]|nr:hypothetical protein [Clostridia bacterium]
MTKFLSLLKIQLLGFLTTGRSRGKKASNGKKVGTLSIILILGAIMVFYGYTYSKIFAEALLLTGEIIQLLPLMMSMACLINFFFSFYGTTNILYSNKDYELLNAMPISKFAIVMSKLCAMIVSNLLFTLCIIIPSFFVYAKFAGDVSFIFVVEVLLMTLFSPFLVSALAIIVGLLISLLASLFVKKNLINGILLIVFMLCIFAISFISGYSMETGLASGIGKIYFILPIAIKGCTSFGYTMLFVGINFGTFALVSTFVILTYKKFNTILSTKRTVKNFKLKQYNSKGQLKSLFNREMKRLFTSPIYFVNCALGVIMNLVICIVVPIVFSSLRKEGLFIDGSIVVLFAPAIFSFCFLLSPSTACSISMEGQSFWVVRTSPISMNKIFNAKMLVNIVLNVPIAVIGTIVAMISIKVKFTLALLCVIVSLLLCTLSCGLGLLFNILFPKLNWTNENQAVKQGAALLFMVLFAFVFTGLFVLIGIKATISPLWIFVIYSATLLIFNIVTYCLIYLYGEQWLIKKV